MKLLVLFFLSLFAYSESPEDKEIISDLEFFESMPFIEDEDFEFHLEEAIEVEDDE